MHRFPDICYYYSILWLLQYSIFIMDFLYFAGTKRLSGGLIAAIAIGSLVGAILVCCWISSVIECIQHMYKYWCSCCHDTDINDITFTTTVIPNPGADPTTIVIAGTLPPSYSSIFRNDAAFMADASSTSLPTYQNGNVYSPPVSGVGANVQQPSGPRSLPQLTGNAVISQHCQHCQCQCQRQQQLQQHQQQQQQQQQNQRQITQQQIPASASLPLPDYPPPRYDPSKDIRWCWQIIILISTW